METKVELIRDLRSSTGYSLKYPKSLLNETDMVKLRQLENRHGRGSIIEDSEENLIMEFRDPVNFN